jgi:predicted secreted protein
MERQNQQRDNPAWLRSMEEMNKLDAEVSLQARKNVESRLVEQAVSAEKERLRKLAEQEKRL